MISFVNGRTYQQWCVGEYVAVNKVFTFSTLYAKLVVMYKMSYSIAQNFDGGNFDVFDIFQLDRQNLTC